MVRVFLDGPPELAVADVATRFGVIYRAALVRANRDLWWEHKRVESARRKGDAVELLKATRALTQRLEWKEEVEQCRSRQRAKQSERAATRRAAAARAREFVLQLFPARGKAPDAPQT